MIEDLIRRARRRFLLNETLAQFAFAAAIFIGGFVLILIFWDAISGMVDARHFRGGRNGDRLVARNQARAQPIHDGGPP